MEFGFMLHCKTNVGNVETVRQIHKGHYLLKLPEIEWVKTNNRTWPD